jgi:hypothetical protein
MTVSIESVTDCVVPTITLIGQPTTLIGLASCSTSTMDASLQVWAGAYDGSVTYAVLSVSRDLETFGVLDDNRDRTLVLCRFCVFGEASLVFHRRDCVFHPPRLADLESM